MTVRTQKPKPILIVDDDTDLLEVLALSLERAGYRVTTARDGREALTSVAEEMPAMILLDMKMPIMSGSEFSVAYRAKYPAPAPIVVLTAAADARSRGQEIGANGVLGKPFELDALMNIVAQYMGTMGTGTD